MNRTCHTLFASLGLLFSAERAAATNAYTFDPPGNLNTITQAIAALPAISVQPANQVASQNGAFSFSVLAAGPGPVSYQWLSNGVPIAGATGDTLVVPGFIVPTNLVSNGGFESPAVVLSAFQTYTATQNLGGWMLDTGSVDVVRSYWVPDEGVQSLDLSGNGPGSIYQDLATVPGQSYYLHFALAGNPAAAPTIKTNQIWWNGSLLDTVTFNTTGYTVSSMGWTNLEYVVTATNTTTRLRFVSLANSSAGPTLDAVSVVPVWPAPAAYSVVLSNASGSITSTVASVLFDTDGNGMPDAWQLAYFGATGQDPNADSDGDGVSNLDEYLEGTNPTDPASFRPRLHIIGTPGGSFSVSPLQPSYALGQSVQLTAIADLGYYFASWTGGITNTNATVSLVMNGHKTVTAVFGQILTNGALYSGTLVADATNIYAFSANAGDSFILQIGEVTGNSTFYPQISVFGPNGALLSSAYDVSGAYLLSRATNSGTFTVLVTSYYNTGAGSYLLNLAQSPGAFVVSPGDEGGTLTNGAAYTGSLPVGDLDMWSFAANAGDSIIVQMGAIVRSNGNFYPQIFLYAPDGTLQSRVSDVSGAYLVTRATNSGTFTVVVNSYYDNGAGTYWLNLAKSPGSFVTSPGQPGGTLTNGAAYTGSLPVGDLNMWSFDANAGDGIIVQMGAIVRSNGNFYPQIFLFGPDGTLQSSVSDASGAYLVTRATNSGTFNVVVNSYYDNGAGTYWLNLAKSPGSFVVSPGDEGGTLTNGAAYTGSLPVGDLDMWSFNANAGDSIIVQMGSIVRSNGNFYPQIFLYGPDGTLQSRVDDASGTYLVTRATNSGTFNVVVNSYYDNGAGTYWLNLAKAPGAFVISPGDEGGPMTNGATYAGSLPTGDLDMWSFNANAGDNLTLRMGATVRSNGNFYPQIFLFGPNGALLAQANTPTDTYVNTRATNSGAFTVVVNSYYDNGAGAYSLVLAQVPEPFVVSPGDEGGPLTNGGNFDGVTLLGDEDMWSFNADKGDNIVLRCANTSGGSYYPWVRLYGPDGSPLANNDNNLDSYVAYQATNSGVFTVLVGSYYSGYTGNYVLRFMEMPGAFIVPPGDEGGWIAPGANYPGVTDLGDEDPWAFIAFKGAPIQLNCQKLSGSGSYYPWIQLYGPNGAYLANTFSATTATINYTPTNTGLFTLLVGSYYQGYTGTYQLSGTGYSEGLTLATPALAGTNLTFTGTGGASNVLFILLSTTNLSTPLPLWTPVSSNRFNASGTFTWTNLFNPAQPQRFFRLSVP